MLSYYLLVFWCDYDYIEYLKTAYIKTSPRI
jgi:hypothetical protein